MKYCFEGYSQNAAVELGLDLYDLSILRWFSDFSGTSKMKQLIDEDTVYYWVNYSAILEDMPVLGISKKTLSRKLQSLCEKEILKHKHVKDGGRYAYYSYGKTYDLLVYNDEKIDVPPLGQIVPPLGQIVPTLRTNCPNKDLNTKNLTTKYTNNKRNSTVLTDDTVEILLNEKLESEKVKQTFRELLETRKAKGKKHRVSTEYCFMLLINNLRKYAKTEDEAISVLNYSIEKNYDGLYDIFKHESEKPEKKHSIFDTLKFENG